MESSPFFAHGPAPASSIPKPLSSQRDPLLVASDLQVLILLYLLQCSLFQLIVILGKYKTISKNSYNNSDNEEEDSDDDDDYLPAANSKDQDKKSSLEQCLCKDMRMLHFQLYEIDVLYKLGSQERIGVTNHRTTTYYDFLHKH